MSEAARIGTMTPPKTACFLSVFFLYYTLDKLLNKLPNILFVFLVAQLIFNRPKFFINQRHH